MEKTEKRTVSIEAEHISRLSCAGCGKMLDVLHLEPFVKIKCPECGMEQIIPAKFGSFLLIKQLGAGGMGVIYRAMDRELGRQVALKIMKKSLGDNVEFVRSFKREAQAAAALNHRNVAQIYSFGQYNGQPFIVMELLDGGKLDDLIAGRGGLDELRALEIHLEVAEGLMAASDVGLVHGDVKPANVLFGKNGEAKVVDFGLASYISEQQLGKPVWGTPYYIAPEKARGKKVDFRSDIYSLGATLFHVLSGKPPFDGPTSNDVVMARLNQPAPDILGVNPNIHPQTAKMVARMLEMDPAMRYPSYPALLVDMRTALKAAEKPLGRQTHISTVFVPLKVSETKLKSLIQKVNLKTALSVAAGILLLALAVAGWIFNNERRARLREEASQVRLLERSREAGQASWGRIVNLAVLISETGNKIIAMADKADGMAASVNRVDDLTAKAIDETDKVKEWLNDAEDLRVTAAAYASQLKAASDTQTARRLSNQIEEEFEKLIAIYGSMQESGELAGELLVQALAAHKKTREEINRQRAEKARAEALRRKAEADEIQARKEEEELKKRRPAIIQEELDAIEKLRGANAFLIAQRKFSEAQRSLASLREKVTLDETLAALRNLEETYAEIAKLKDWLINAINANPCPNCWIMGSSGHDVVKADSASGITIALGTAGTTIIQWEAVSLAQLLKIINYYADFTNLAEPQRAIILKQTALLCYESGVFKTAETYARAACKTNPDLRADLNRLMPDIVSPEL